MVFSWGLAKERHMSKLPKYPGEIPYVPMNYEDAASLTTGITQIIEASVPNKTQKDAMKSLVHDKVDHHFRSHFESAHHILTEKSDSLVSGYSEIVKAIWYASITNTKTKQEQDVDDLVRLNP